MVDHKEPVKEIFQAEQGLKLKFKNHQGIYVAKGS